VPAPIKDEIDSWGLPLEIVDALFDRIQTDLEYGHEHICFRLSAPTPTFVYRLSLPDPAVPFEEHSFSFYLCYGPREDALYVMQSDYHGLNGEDTNTFADSPF
jgi:hypothetical protein